MPFELVPASEVQVYINREFNDLPIVQQRNITKFIKWSKARSKALIKKRQMILGYKLKSADQVTE